MNLTQQMQAAINESARLAGITIDDSLVDIINDILSGETSIDEIMPAFSKSEFTAIKSEIRRLMKMSVKKLETVKKSGLRAGKMTGSIEFDLGDRVVISYT